MPRKVLVVEDERQIARLIEINLQRAGYDVIVASDGEEGLEMIKEENPDIMVLDDFMPKMKGPDLMRRLKQDPARTGKTTDDREIIFRPMVVTLWSRYDDASQFEAWNLGCFAHHTKPFNPRKIVSSVDQCAQELKRKPRQEPQEPI